LVLLGGVALGCTDKTDETDTDGYLDTDADYVESNDLDNNAVQWDWAPLELRLGPGTPEDTEITLTTGESYLIAGSCIDNGEAAESDNDDHDSYAINTGAFSKMLVLLDVSGLSADVDVLLTDTLAVDLGGPGLVLNGTSDDFDGDYEERFASPLLDPSTKYFLNVGSYSQSTVYPIRYRLRVAGVSEVEDAYVEADDLGNNAAQVSFTGGVITGPGAPEQTGLLLEPLVSQVISGTVVDNNESQPGQGSYDDHDTFLINSGALSQVSIQLDVAGTTADLDVFVTDLEGTVVASGLRFGSGTDDAFDGSYEENFSSQLLTPDTDYWLTVSSFPQGANYPVAYEVRIIGIP